MSSRFVMVVSTRRQTCNGRHLRRATRRMLLNDAYVRVTRQGEPIALILGLPNNIDRNVRRVRGGLTSLNYVGSIPTPVAKIKKGEEFMADEKEEKEEKKVNGAVSAVVQALRKSVIANGDEVMELTFREPTAADIERAGGNPVNIDMSSGTAKISFDARAMTQMMGLLATVPPSTIRQLHPRDWNTIAWQLA